MTRILIVGSCVTRDAFELPEAEGISLADYYARTSLASAFGGKAFPGVDLSAMTSAFQRRMVERDQMKALPSRIAHDDYDLVVYDPVDERFDLLRAPDGALATYSAELAGILPETSAWERVKSGTDEFFDLWERGWRRFVETLDNGGRRGLLRVNKVYWAEHTASGAKFTPKHPPDAIERANAFLDRIYGRIAADLSPEQFITYSHLRLVGADEHKWGLSPFHFTDDYYRDLLRQLVDPVMVLPSTVPDGTAQRLSDVQRQLDDALAERSVVTRRVIAVQSGYWVEETGARERAENTWTNGTLALSEVARTSFTGEDGSYELRIGLTRPLPGADGMTFRIRLEGWSAIRYVALGHTREGFRHVKIPNPPIGEWFTFSFGYGDQIDQMQNKDVPSEANAVRDVRIYVRGTPGCDAEVALDWAAAWSRGRASLERSVRLPGGTPSTEAVASAIASYLRQRNPLLTQQVDAFEQTGEFPVSGGKFLRWPPEEREPPSLKEVGTYGHVWHSQHLAGALLAVPDGSDKCSRTAAARELVSAWLDDNYFTAGDSSRYVWYDHAVAERTLVLLLMHERAFQQGHDARFLTRLGSAIVGHAQLLESEAFYAAQQPSRFHNHAWFQDVALLAAGVCLEGYPAASRWRRRSLERLERQFEELVVLDGAYAVFVENSTGYHIGIQSLASFADSLARIAGQGSVTSAVADGMQRWTELIRYPDGRVPAHGDTFRLPNPTRIPSAIGPGPKAKFAVLPTAGYAVARGAHGDARWALALIASSRSATHKHEDNLSMTLYAEGVEWLIDPSFFSHEYAHPIPDALRRASMHSAPWVSGVPYNTTPGTARIAGELTGENTFRVEGRHSSFESYEVRRTVEGSLKSLALTVRDEITPLHSSAGDPDCWFTTFHLGDGVMVAVNAGDVLLSHPATDLQLRLSLPSDVTVDVVSGWSDERGSGSVSGLGFMEVVDSTSIIVRWKASGLGWRIEALRSSTGD